MGLKKILKKLAALLDMEAETNKKYQQKLKTLLKNLKAKEKKLKNKLEASESELERERLEKELNIVHSQRMKGIDALRKSKKNCHESS